MWPPQTYVDVVQGGAPLHTDSTRTLLLNLPVCQTSSKLHNLLCTAFNVHGAHAGP